MKNKQEIVGIITNIALVVLLFCFIVCVTYSKICEIKSKINVILKLVGRNFICIYLFIYF